MSNKELNIVMMDVNNIIPYWRNPRHNDKTVDVLCEVIPVYGFNVPIVIDKRFVIIKGHARLRAAKRLGMKEVPCIISENDDETNKADRIADNKIQEMSFWDVAKLELEYQRIGDLKFDRLFHPEEFNPFDVQPDKSITFAGTSLDDYGDYSSEAVSSDETFDRFQTSPSPVPQQENMDDFIPHELPTSTEAVLTPPSSLPHGRKALRTICPYCGADVYITL